MSFLHGFFYVYSRRAFPLSFCFSFLKPSGFHLRGKTGFSASLLHGKKSFFRLLVQVARKFCGHWKIAFSRMIFRCAESESRKCRMEAKNVLDVCFFVNVWLPVAGNIRFLQRWRMRWALSFCRRLISFSDVLFAAIGQCGLTTMSRSSVFVPEFRLHALKMLRRALKDRNFLFVCLLYSY